MNIDKLIQSADRFFPCDCFSSLMNIDKLIPIYADGLPIIGFGSLMNIKLKETACGIMFCKLLFITKGEIEGQRSLV